MALNPSKAPPNDKEAMAFVVQYLKSQGTFDEFRKECLSDLDTKPSFLNLRQRVEGYVSRFLSQQQWNPTLNKNQLRERLRRQISESGMVKYGIEHLVDQAVNSKTNSIFYPKIESVVKHLLGIRDPVSELEQQTQKQTDIVWPEDDGEAKVEKMDDEPVPEEDQIDEKMLEEPTPEKAAGEVEVKVEVKVEEDLEDAKSPFSASTPIEAKAKAAAGEESGESNSSDSMNSHKKSVSHSSASQGSFPSLKSKTEGEKSKPAALPVVVKSEAKVSVPWTSQNPTGKQAVKSMPECSTSMAVQASAKKSIEKVSHFASTSASLDDYLSDVSSVHTSDLSDFDDRISFSSGDEENEAEKKKLTLKEVKQFTNKAVKDKSVDSESEPILENLAANATQESDPRESKNFKRERRANPKYASDDFSSMFNKRRKNSDAKDLEEDTEIIPKTKEKPVASKSKQTEAKHSVDQRLHDDSRDSLDAEVDDERNQRPSVESKPEERPDYFKQLKKKMMRRAEAQSQQRYEASDLYKPRPVIGSRRQRSSLPGSEPTS